MLAPSDRGTSPRGFAIATAIAIAFGTVVLALWTVVPREESGVVGDAEGRSEIAAAGPTGSPGAGSDSDVSPPADSAGLAPATAGSQSSPPRVKLRLRIEPEGFDASEADIRAVLESAAGELLRSAGEEPLEPIVVQRGRDGPITLFDRNARGEIVVRLDTSGTYWCQYAYQFSHELAHVLCGVRRGADSRHKWFEETLCETASLYAIRAMARRWKHEPPYPHWADFRDALGDYADKVIAGHALVEQIHAIGMARFREAHSEPLENDPCLRPINGAMAVVLLRYFEAQPELWESLRWRNPPADGAEGAAAAAFEQHLAAWHARAPQRHRAGIARLAALYGFRLEAP